MKILWLTNIPSPYRLKFFSELGKQAELTVLFEKGFSAERDETWKDFTFENFTGVVLKGIPVITDMALSLGFKKYIQQYRNDIIVVSNPITPTGISAILYMQVHHIKYCIESDGAFPKECMGIRGKLKKRLYSKTYLCLTTSELGKQYFENYGVPENRIEKYPLSSLKESEIINEQNIVNFKKAYKKKLEITGEKMILAVGQFIPRKGFDLLIKAAGTIGENVGMYIIGGIPREDYLSLLNDKTKNNIHFLPFMKPEKVREYYLAADLFVFPTHEDIWGLVIIEAMAQANPVITTNMCISGLEMITDGVNGYIVEDSNLEQLVSRIKDVFSTDNYQSMCEESVSIARKYTIEKMVQKHIKIFNERLIEA